MSRFPLLKPNDIVQCMRDMGIPFSEEDLMKPSPGRMQSVYEQFAELFMGVFTGEFDSAIQKCGEILEYPQVHCGSIGLMAFHQHIVQLMNQVGIFDFSIRDVLKPEPGRVKRILSGVINFAKFREEQLETYEELSKQSENYLRAHSELSERNLDFMHQITGIKQQREEEEPFARQVKEANKQLTQQLYGLKSTQSKIQEQTDRLKRERNMLQEKMKNTSLSLSNTKREVEQIHLRIVPAPEKLRQAVMDMSESLMNDKNAIANLEKRLRDLQMKTDILIQLEQDLISSLKAMEECETEVARVEEASKKETRHREMVDHKEIEVRECTIKETQLHRQLAHAEEKLSRVQKQAEQKRQAAQLRMEDIRKEYESMTKERAARSREMDLKKASIERTEKKIVTQETQVVETEWAKLNSHIEQYMEEMRHCMATVG